MNGKGFAVIGYQHVSCKTGTNVGKIVISSIIPLEVPINLMKYDTIARKYIGTKIIYFIQYFWANFL